ncbi:hypothetical protein BV22DRAFT_1089058 [Leucogyrophana mollusca]|uniref:Uncharacterized protein n=1 Tax=Leucogyrophana mollusca TaxID=85980 RepID=A0ACB8BIB1_9AGAM|nr:hypothetical protein BV22DRAFT_1089058 [Leucogyrophana mollusca]
MVEHTFIPLVFVTEEAPHPAQANHHSSSSDNDQHWNDASTEPGIGADTPEERSAYFVLVPIFFFFQIATYSKYSKLSKS